MSTQTPVGWKVDWEGTPDSALRELLRQGELFLQGTIQLGIAGDQRAVALSTIFGGGAIALLAAAATLLAGAHPSVPLECAAGVTALFLLVGSFLAAIAAHPVDFFVAGYEPKQLHTSSSDELWMLRYTAQDIQMRIDTNRAAVARAAFYSSNALRVAALGIFSGCVVFGALTIALGTAPITCPS